MFKRHLQCVRRVPLSQRQRQKMVKLSQRSGGSGAQGSAEFAHDERMIQNIQSTAKVASHSLAFWPSCLAGLAPSLEGFFTKRSQIEAIEEILYMNISTNMTCSVGGVCKPVQTSG